MSRKRSMRALSPMFVTLPSTRSETRNRLRSHHSRLRFKADLTQGRDDVEEMLGGKLPPILPLHSNSRKQHDRAGLPALRGLVNGFGPTGRSEEHTSELQSLMRNSYAVFCLKKKHTT